MKNGSIREQINLQERMIASEKEKKQDNQQAIKEKEQIIIQKEKKQKRGMKW